MSQVLGAACLIMVVQYVSHVWLDGRIHILSRSWRLAANSCFYTISRPLTRHNNWRRPRFCHPELFSTYHRYIMINQRELRSTKLGNRRPSFQRLPACFASPGGRHQTALHGEFWGLYLPDAWRGSSLPSNLYRDLESPETLNHGTIINPPSWVRTFLFFFCGLYGVTMYCKVIRLDILPYFTINHRTVSPECRDHLFVGYNMMW